MEDDELIPPDNMIFVGDGDFKQIGEAFLREFTSLCGLQPNHRVLDVGCGIGRTAIPLTKYLNGQGGYEGFDIVPRGINWCKERITPKFPNFHFQLIDVYNKEYNPEGRYQARDFHFPFDNGYFDFALATSVFTHMLDLDMQNYLREIARVLKEGAKCLITFFLLNYETLASINAGRTSLSFVFDFGRYRGVNSEVPEAAVAYDEPFIFDLYKKNGLEISAPVRYGMWCERKDKRYGGYQDEIIAAKRPQ